LEGPGRHNWNLSLFKNFVLSEKRGSKLELRAESFNIFNHTQFQGSNVGGITLDRTRSDFGHITAAFDPRVFQLGVKAQF
jgi:3D (Asp-Asp-Asp) domain-containing protein